MADVEAETFEDASEYEDKEKTQGASSPIRNGGDGQRPRRPRWRDYTAFVLSGGTARGALQVGALRALIELGERPDVIIGTSIGAWNGAILALDPTLAGVERLTDIWRGINSASVLLGIEPPANTPQQVIRARVYMAAAQRFAAGHPSLYSDTGLQHMINKHLAGVTFEDMRVPLRVIAADITHGTRMTFGSGLVAPAILASSAIPGVFPPVRVGESVYVDGGALDNASLETALDLGARRIFVVDVGYDESNSGSSLWQDELTPNSSWVRGNAIHALGVVLERTVQAVSRYQLERAIERIPPGIETRVIHAATGVRGNSMDFEKAPEWLEIGYQTTSDFLRAQLPRPVASPV
jgi:NTE family protein